jgi:16S rRNA (guanine527-N7)-methyltransferase
LSSVATDEARFRRQASEVDTKLLGVLAEARERGFLGPGEVDAHVAHSLAFVGLVPVVPARAVDLGSGAGVPGLILAQRWPESAWLLVDANQRRARFLREAVARLGLGPRVAVAEARAEVLGRDGNHRQKADLVVARGFGSPAVTAECAAPLLRSGGALVVAEPPGGDPERWPDTGLEVLGLVRDAAVAHPVALQRLLQATPCPERYPRRVGIPAKRPLW